MVSLGQRNRTSPLTYSAEAFVRKLNFAFSLIYLTEAPTRKVKEFFKLSKTAQGLKQFFKCMN